MKNIVKILTDNIYDIITNNDNDLIFNEGVNMWLVGNNMIFIEDNKTKNFLKLKLKRCMKNENNRLFKL